MATQKITNKVALAIATEVLTHGTDLSEVSQAQGFTSEDVLAKLAHMTEQASKPRAKVAKKETSAHKDNKAFAFAIARAVIAKDLSEISNRWIVENITGILSTQKATSVMKVAVEELGLFTKSRDKKNALVFSLAEDITSLGDVDDVEDAFLN